MSAQIYTFVFICIHIYIHACVHTHTQRLFDIIILILALTKKITGMWKMLSLTESNFQSNHPSL